MYLLVVCVFACERHNMSVGDIGGPCGRHRFSVGCRNSKALELSRDSRGWGLAGALATDPSARVPRESQSLLPSNIIEDHITKFHRI